MKRLRKLNLRSWLFLALALTGSSLLVYRAWATGLLAASGTITASTASALTFTQDIKQFLIINNRNPDAEVAYIKLYRDYADSTPTSCSATVYDIALDQNEQIILDRSQLQYFPVDAVQIFTASTTPTLRVVGR